MISRCIQRANDTPACAAIGVVGIGNTLGGDDAAGIRAAQALHSRFDGGRNLFIYPLEGDLFAMADLVGKARHFIFIDAYIGRVAGERLIVDAVRANPLPSLHQTDIGAVMHMLQALRLVDPFPTWEILGISIVPPLVLGAPLSPAVAAAVERTVEEVSARIAAAAA